MSAAVRASQHTRSGPRAVILLAILLAASGILLATARPVRACSCASFTSMKDYATADTAVFTGTAGARDRRGVPVSVDRWYWGRGAAPVVWLAASSFGDGSSCGTNPPPVGSAWIWVTWLPPDGVDPATGLCSPSGDLSTPEGQKLLAEAETVFEAVLPSATSGSSTPPGRPSTLAPTATTAPDPAAIARERAGLTIAVSLVAVVLILFVGLTLLARRSNRGSADRS